MNLKDFQNSLSGSEPPRGISWQLEALWYDAKGNWNKAHEVVQDIEGKDAAWIHAYLHRKEGDRSNAGYWYSRAGKSIPGIGLDEEWEALVNHFI